MHIRDTGLKNAILAEHKVKGGKVYIFKNFLVSEFEEGQLLKYDTFCEVYQLLDTYSENKPNFGYITNRVNSYIVDTGDFIKAMTLAPRNYPTAVVAYSDRSKNNHWFEKEIYKCNSIVFDCLEKAGYWFSKSLAHS